MRDRKVPDAAPIGSSSPAAPFADQHQRACPIWAGRVEGMNMGPCLQTGSRTRGCHRRAPGGSGFRADTIRQYLPHASPLKRPGVVRRSTSASPVEKVRRRALLGSAGTVSHPLYVSACVCVVHRGYCYATAPNDMRQIRKAGKRK